MLNPELYQRMVLQIPLVHLFLNVFTQFIYLALQLLPPLFWWQVAEVFWSGALKMVEERAGKGNKNGKETDRNCKIKKKELNNSLFVVLLGVFSS